MQRRTLMRLGAAAGGFAVAGGLFATGTWLHTGDGGQGSGGDTRDGWPQYRYDAAKTGFKPAPGPAAVGEHRTFNGHGLGVVADGTLYSRRPIFAAYDALDWTRRWIGSGGSDGIPAVADGLVVRVSAQTVYAHDAADGQTVWEASLPVDYMDPGPLTVADGRVYVSAEKAWKAEEGVLAGIGLADGDRHWAVTDPDMAAAAPAVADGRVVVAQGTKLVAYDAEDGAEQWRVPLEPWYTPCVADGTVYVSTDGAVVARDLSDGSLEWRREVPTPTGPPAVAPHGIYVGTTDGVVALDRDGVLPFDPDGEVRWVAGDSVESAVIATEEAVYAGEDPGRIRGRASSDGDLLWEVPTSAITAGDLGYMSLTGEPLLAGGNLYAFHSGKRIHLVLGTDA